MIISAYFFDQFFDTQPVEQFFLDLQQTSISITKELTEFGSCEFSLPLNANVNIAMKVVVYEEDSVGNGKVIFSWYIYQIKPILDRSNKIMLVTCYDEKHFLTKRKILSTFSLINQPIEIIAQNLETAYNSNWDARTHDIVWINTSVELKFGDNYYDAFNEVCESLNLQRDVFQWKITIKTIIGKDKTFWVDYAEAIYTDLESNISWIEVLEEDSRNNLVLVRWQSGATAMYPATLPTPIYWVAFKEVRDWWNLSDVAQNIYNQLQLWLLNYKFTLEQGALNANVWDKIVLRVEWLWKYDFVWSTTVLKKTTEYENGVKKEDIEVWESTVERKSLAWVIRNIQAEVNLIKTW